MVKIYYLKFVLISFKINFYIITMNNNNIENGVEEVGRSIRREE